MVWSFIMAACGVLWVQPFAQVTRCCCKCCDIHCPTVLFTLSIIFSILSLIVWGAGNEYCTDDLWNSDDSYWWWSYQYDFGLAASMILEIMVA